jgi:hypothetical protein
MVLLAIPVSAASASDATTFAVLHASEPLIPAGQGRFYFYREGGLMGVALQPSVMIDGVSAGARAKPGDYFYVDRPAGTYEISTETEKKEAVSATIAAGQSMYVRFDVSMGLFVGHISPSIIDPQQALNEIRDCDFHGPTVAASPGSNPAQPPGAASPTEAPVASTTSAAPAAGTAPSTAQPVAPADSAPATTPK